MIIEYKRVMIQGVHLKEDHMLGKYLITANDLMEEFDVSRSKAYGIIKELNSKLSSEGYVVIPGKIPRPFLEDKFYGLSQNEA